MRPVGAKARADLSLEQGRGGICLKRLVGERGFEPPTPWSRTRCSTRLSHSPTMRGRLRKCGTPAQELLDILADYNTRCVSDCHRPTVRRVDPRLGARLKPASCTSRRSTMLSETCRTATIDFRDKTLMKTAFTAQPPLHSGRGDSESAARRGRRADRRDSLRVQQETPRQQRSRWSTSATR